MPRLLLFVCITCVATHSVHAQRTVTDCVRITVPHPETVNPGAGGWIWQMPIYEQD